MIAPAEPSALIGRSEQCLNLWAGEKMYLGPCETLARDGQHALDLGGMFWRFERGIPEERVDGSQPQISATRAQTPVLLHVIEKRHDQRGIDLLESQSRRRRVQPLLCELQQQTEGITIRTDRMRTGLTLLHETLGEEPFQEWREAGSGGFHDWPSQHRSRRDIASRISSGHALRYQYVSLTWT